MKPTLIIDNYDSFTYNLVHQVESLGYSTVVYRNDAISLEEVGQYDQIIISPGPGLPADAGITTDVIKAYAPEKKILGVCLGLQAIVEVFGGKLVNMPEVMHGLENRLIITDYADPLFKEVKDKCKIGHYHSWMADPVQFPEELVITATDEKKQIMAIRHKQFKLHGVQFHPESVLTENGAEIMKNWLKI